MDLAAFDKLNLKSKKVRLSIGLLAFVTVGYVLGIVIYLARQGAPAEAMKMARLSSYFFIFAIMLSVFLVTLRWQILRTVILGLSLLALASLYCALVLLLFESPIVHAAGLVGLNVLFVVLFLSQSNLRIYLLDRSYVDASLEGMLALCFMAVVVFMIASALKMV